MEDGFKWVQAFANISVVAAVGVYFFQLCTMRQQRADQKLVNVVYLLQQPQLFDDRNTLTVQLVNQPLSTWTTDQKNAAERACSAYDVALILIEHADQKTQNAITENWGESMVNCCKAAEPLINQQRTKRPRRWAHLRKFCGCK